MFWSNIQKFIYEKATDTFEILANEGDADFSYVDNLLKFNGALMYKDTGVALSKSCITSTVVPQTKYLQLDRSLRHTFRRCWCVAKRQYLCSGLPSRSKC